MFGLRMLTAISLSALLVPFGGASPGPVDVPDEVEIEGDLALTENTVTVGPETFYVFASQTGGEMWRETNGCDRLQRSAGISCGSFREADTRLGAVP